ncbi:MAG: hypothetical protein SOT81_10380 [Treponema sp.]|nr:hypothetical protein [Treponema sp.]
MTSAQKVASSLLVSVLAFSIFTVAAFSGLFDFVEVKFYQPAVKQLKEQKLDEIKDAENEYLESLMSRFNIFEMEKDVKTYADLRPDDISVQNREKLRSTLMTETAALLGIRLVDDNGSNVYFSTFDSDKIKSAKGSVSYKNYGSLNEFPFELVKSSDWIAETAPSGEKGRVIKDSRLNRLIFSFPFYDSKNSFRGTLLFYCDANHLNRYLFSRNLIDMSGFCVLVAAENGDPKFDAGFGGYVFGLPNFGRKSAEQQILSEWKQNSEKSFWKMAFEENESAENISNPQKLEESSKLEKPAENSEKFLKFKDSDEKSGQKSYFVFSKKLERSDAGFVAAIYDENELKFPKFLRLLLLVSAFITFYLVVFLIFSFKHDDIVVIKSKIASFKKQFVRQYKKMAGIENDSDLELHKKNLEESIKKSLGRLAVKYEPEFQNLFEKCWNEILLEIEKPYAMIPSDSVVVNKNELREILEDIVNSGKIKVSAVEIQQKPAPAIESAEKNSQPNENSFQKNDSDEEKIEENVKSEKMIETAEKVAENFDVDDAEELEILDESEKAAETETSGKIVENGKHSETANLTEKIVPTENQNAENDEIETLEPLEVLDEAESLEPIDETENSAEHEDFDNVEELEILDDENDGVEELQPLEPVDEAEELEILDDESGELETLENVDSSEKNSSIDEEKKITSFDDKIEEIEPLKDEENIGDSGKLQENDGKEISENDGVEELQPLEPVDEAEDLEEIESLEDDEVAENVVETENAEKIDDIEDLEPLDDVEELSPLDDEENLDELPKNEVLSNEEKTGELPNATTTSIKENADEQSETEATLAKENSSSSPDEKSDFDDVYKDEPFLEKIDFGVAETKTNPKNSETENEIIDNFSTENLDYAFLDEEPAEDFGKLPEKENPQNPEIQIPDSISEMPQKAESSTGKTSQNPQIQTETSSVPSESNSAPEGVPENPEAVPENPRNPEKKSENSAEFSKKYEEKKSDSDNIIAVGKDAHFEKELEQVSEDELPELESERDEPAETQNQNDTEEISALEELESPEETMPFSFIQIAANDTNLTELRAEVSDTIVQNSDGTFRIADKSAYYSNKGIDLNLKRLVDSVLKN